MLTFENYGLIMNLMVKLNVLNSKIHYKSKVYFKIKKVNKGGISIEPNLEEILNKLKNEREVKINYILDTIIEIRNELKYVKEQLEEIRKNTEETNQTLHYNFCDMARMFNDTTDKIIKELTK